MHRDEAFFESWRIGVSGVLDGWSDFEDGVVKTGTHGTTRQNLRFCAPQGHWLRARRSASTLRYGGLRRLTPSLFQASLCLRMLDLLTCVACIRAPGSWTRHQYGRWLRKPDLDSFVLEVELVGKYSRQKTRLLNRKEQARYRQSQGWTFGCEAHRGRGTLTSTPPSRELSWLASTSTGSDTWLCRDSSGYWTEIS